VISAAIRTFSELAFGRTPFNERPMLNRENTLGYSWPPHLYQGSLKLEEN